jgi:hypothetical protein
MHSSSGTLLMKACAYELVISQLPTGVVGSLTFL